MKKVFILIFIFSGLYAQSLVIDPTVIEEKQNELYELRDQLSVISENFLEMDKNFEFYMSKEGNLAIEVAIRLNNHLLDLIKIKASEDGEDNRNIVDEILSGNIENYFKPQYEWVLQGMDYIILNSETESLRELFAKGKNSVKNVYELF